MMTYAVSFETGQGASPELGRRLYEAIWNRVAQPSPEGLLMQVGALRSSGIWHLQIWESQAAADDFHLNRARPAAIEVVTEAGLPVPAGPPIMEVIDVFHLWQANHDLPGNPS